MQSCIYPQVFSLAYWLAICHLCNGELRLLVPRQSRGCPLLWPIIMLIGRYSLLCIPFLYSGWGSSTTSMKGGNTGSLDWVRVGFFRLETKCCTGNCDDLFIQPYWTQENSFQYRIYKYFPLW